MVAKADPPVINAKEGKVVNKNEWSCCPVTIKQIKKVKLVNEDQFLLDQHEITNVAVIGIVRSITKQDTHTAYTIENGSGALDVRYRVFDEIEQNISASFNELECNTYVKVIGRLRSFNQHTSLIATFIRPIEDFNEISFHLLSVIHTHLSSRSYFDDNHKI